ncbi:hypothetical protein GGX14DRAFT_547040 [Mycena pura]|uniref:Zn(2)-C6 fungal-type domain-containing protein n=1 Tax=Mycena pura TaxID=153505 RepID=A0AAD6Y377_9AGAR|nr:hypothetical protein GGX14DRAFT_547040 [Mycena pura]
MSQPSTTQRETGTRAHMACVHCRRRHIKCEATKNPRDNTCVRCIRKGLQCEYLDIAEDEPRYASATTSQRPRPAPSPAPPRSPQSTLGPYASGPQWGAYNVGNQYPSQPSSAAYAPSATGIRKPTTGRGVFRQQLSYAVRPDVKRISNEHELWILSFQSAATELCPNIVRHMKDSATLRKVRAIIQVPMGTTPLINRCQGSNTGAYVLRHPVDAVGRPEQPEVDFFKKCLRN